MKKYFLFFFLLTFTCSAFAKERTKYTPSPYSSGSLQVHGTVGGNYICGIFGGFDFIGGYQYKDLGFHLGVGVTSQPVNRMTLQAIDFQVDYLFRIPKCPLDLRFQYLYNPHRYSTIEEHVWGISLAYVHPHVEVELGYYIRYNHSNETFSTNSTEATSYAEFTNSIYRIQAWIWPKGNPYNISFSLKNKDIMYMGHTTDPMIAMEVSYAYPKELRYFVEGVYQAAGVGSIAFNHYEWRARIGIAWEIGPKK